MPYLAKSDSEIAVAIRYLKAKGVSHSHIYLYREDGKLLRQLTSSDAGQDCDPIFSPNGESIVFTRELTQSAKEYWSVEPLSGKLQRLTRAPEWYTASKDTPFFKGASSPSGNEPLRIRTPDNSVEIVMRELEPDAPYDEDAGGDGPGRHYELRNLKTGKAWKMGTLPGFGGLEWILNEPGATEKYFIWDSKLKVAFLGYHESSGMGNPTYALNVVGRRLVELSPNGAAPIDLPGEPAFLTFTSIRYVPIPNSQMTANSCYIDHWDSALHRVRYSRDTSAVCYGASMYRPGKTPNVIKIHRY